MLLFAPIGEEFGWRGFMLERLQKKWSPLKAGIIIGLVWGLWHLPFFFIPGKVLNDYYNLSKMSLVLFPVYAVGLSVIYTWIYNGARSSIFILILLHAFNNWSFETFYPVTTISGFHITYILIIFFAIWLVLKKPGYWILLRGNNIKI